MSHDMTVSQRSGVVRPTDNLNSGNNQTDQRSDLQAIVAPNLAVTGSIGVIEVPSLLPPQVHSLLPPPAPRFRLLNSFDTPVSERPAYQGNGSDMLTPSTEETVPSPTDSSVQTPEHTYTPSAFSASGQ